MKKATRLGARAVPMLQAKKRIDVDTLTYDFGVSPGLVVMEEYISYLEWKA